MLHSPFAKLPKELKLKFLVEYFYPTDALRFLRVCKFFFNLPNEHILREMHQRFLKYVSYTIQVNDLNRRIICPSCFIQVFSKEGLKKHLAKHQRHKEKPIKHLRNERSSKRVSKPCVVCQAPMASIFHHVCYATDEVSCISDHYLKYYPWTSTTCQMRLGYRRAMNGHKCKMSCKECLAEWETTLTTSPYDHFAKCEFRDEIPAKYGVNPWNWNDEDNHIGGIIY